MLHLRLFGDDEEDEEDESILNLEDCFPILSYHVTFTKPLVSFPERSNTLFPIVLRIFTHGIPHQSQIEDTDTKTAQLPLLS